jgi:hypothetical protein
MFTVEVNTLVSNLGKPLDDADRRVFDSSRDCLEFFRLMTRRPLNPIEFKGSAPLTYLIVHEFGSTPLPLTTDPKLVHRPAIRHRR